MVFGGNYFKLHVPMAEQALLLLPPLSRCLVCLDPSLLPFQTPVMPPFGVCLDHFPASWQLWLMSVWPLY